MCVKSWAEEWEVTEHEARCKLRQPRTQKHFNRAAAFKQAKEETMDMWQFLAEQRDEERALADRASDNMMQSQWFRLCHIGHCLLRIHQPQHSTQGEGSLQNAFLSTSRCLTYRRTRQLAKLPT